MHSSLSLLHIIRTCACLNVQIYTTFICIFLNAQVQQDLKYREKEDKTESEYDSDSLSKQKAIAFI